MLLMGLILIYIDYHGVAVDWGNGLIGLLAQQALHVLNSISPDSLTDEVNCNININCNSIHAQPDTSNRVKVFLCGLISKSNLKS